MRYAEMPPFIPLHIRYERHINRTESCWLWRGHCGSHGYPIMKVGRTGNGPVWLVHRWAYQHFVGPIPPGMLVCHRCDVKACSNPAHLFLGTHQDNVSDMIAKGRHRAAKGPYPFVPRHRKLTDDDVRSIRSDERPYHVIGAQYKISESHVCGIKKRVRKERVPDDGPMTEQSAPKPVWMQLSIRQIASREYHVVDAVTQHVVDICTTHRAAKASQRRARRVDSVA